MSFGNSDIGVSVSANHAQDAGNEGTVYCHDNKEKVNQPSPVLSYYKKN